VDLEHEPNDLLVADLAAVKKNVDNLLLANFTEMHLVGGWILYLLRLHVHVSDINSFYGTSIPLRQLGRHHLFSAPKSPTAKCGQLHLACFLMDPSLRIIVDFWDEPEVLRLGWPKWLNSLEHSAQEALSSLGLILYLSPLHLLISLPLGK